jgi:hypothetical protein
MPGVHPRPWQLAPEAAAVFTHGTVDRRGRHHHPDSMVNQQDLVHAAQLSGADGMWAMISARSMSEWGRVASGVGTGRCPAGSQQALAHGSVEQFARGSWPLPPPPPPRRGETRWPVAAPACRSGTTLRSAPGFQTAVLEPPPRPPRRAMGPGMTTGTLRGCRECFCW